MCSGIRLSSEFSGQPYTAFFLLLRPSWLNRIALILTSHSLRDLFPLQKLDNRVVLGRSGGYGRVRVEWVYDVQSCSNANNDVLYFCADYHVNDFLKFVTWTQNWASAFKWASLVNRTHMNIRHILRFKLPVRFKYVECRLLRFANALLAFHPTNLTDQRLLRRAAFMQTSQSSFPVPRGELWSFRNIALENSYKTTIPV